MLVRRLLVAAITGALLSAVLFLMAFALHGNAMLGVLIFSSIPTATVLGKLLPESFMYLLVPDGGAPAAVLLLIASAWLQLMVVLSAVTFVFLGRRMRSGYRKPPPTS